MPVTCPIQLRVLSEREFKDLDYRVMSHAFAAQNEMGRLCDEDIYQRDLAARVEADGLGPGRCEVPVSVSHDGFCKTYYLDLVVADSAIYELKTVQSLTNEHHRQLLNYLFLLDQPRGKLVNFRSAAVEHRYASTSLNGTERRNYQLVTDRWRELDERGAELHRVLAALLADWGTFLELTLYLEAVVHFLGGEDAVLRDTPLMRDGLRLGSQRFYCLNESVGFRFTAFTEDVERNEAHLVQFLKHTPLKAVQWVNFNHHRVEFVTLTK